MEVYEKDWHDSVSGAIDYLHGNYNLVGDSEDLIQEYMDKYRDEFIEYLQENLDDFKRERGISDEEYKRDIDLTVWDFILQAEPEECIRERLVDEGIIQIFTPKKEKTVVKD